MSVTRQLNLFGVEAAGPSPLDLDGLLAGPGQVVRMGGTARVSVVVDQAWRAAALTAELRERGLTGTCVPTAEQHIGVRTSYAAVLAPLATRWLRGALKAAPVPLRLDGRRLRLWLIAVGHREPAGMVLRLGHDETLVWPQVGRALDALGLPVEMLGARAGGPAYRIVGRRRIARLAELVGEPPSQAPPDVWP